MKKLVLILLAALLPLISPFALADVIFEPEDSFYVTHRDHCTYVNRSHLTNGADGAAVIWDSPESETSQVAVRNGASLYISHTYAGADGVWGIVEYEVDAEGKIMNSYSTKRSVGWIRMEQMLPEYDSQAFIEAHEAELAPYTGDYEAILQAGEHTVLWSYPGSGVTAGTLYEPANLTLERAYTDDAGRVWGHIGYHYGMRDVWVCVSDPANPDIEAAGRPAIALHPAKPESAVMKALGNRQAAPIRLAGGALSQSAVMVIILVAAVVVATAILIKVLMKKRGR